VFILINSINYTFTEGILWVFCNKIEIANYNKEGAKPIIEKLALGVNLYKLTHRVFSTIERNLPVFEMQAQGINMQAIVDAFKNQDSYNQIIAFEMPVIASNLMEFFNQKYFRDFIIDLQFINLPLVSQVLLEKNNVECHRIRIAGPDKVASHIAEVVITMFINGQKLSLAGLIDRDISKNNTLHLGLRNMPLKLHFLGFIKSKLYFNKALQRLVLNDFLQFDLVYNPAARKINFNFTTKNLVLNSVFIEKNLVRLKSLEASGVFDRQNSTLNIPNYQLIISEETGLENLLSGKLHLSKDNLMINSTINNAFHHDLIYDYWPKKYATNARDFLQKGLKNALIEKASITLLLDLKSGVAKISDLLTQFKIVEATYDFNGKQFYFDKLQTDISTKDVNIYTNGCVIDGKIPMQKFDINSNFVNKQTTINFNVTTPLKHLHGFTQTIKLPVGDIYASGAVELPWNNNKTILKISSLNGIVDGQRIKSQNIICTLDKNKLAITGGINYGDISLEKIKATINNVFEVKRQTHFYSEIPITAVRALVQNYNLHPTGEKITISANYTNNSGKIQINLHDIALQNNFKFNKNNQEIGNINFSFHHTNNIWTINDFKLELPDIRLLANFTIKNRDIVAGKWKFDKYHNSMIEIIHQEPSKYQVLVDNYDVKDLTDAISTITNNDKNFVKQAVVELSLNNIQYNKKAFFEQGIFIIELENNQLIAIDGSAQSKDTYLRLFFNKPVLAVIANNLGEIVKQISNSTVLTKGAFALYGEVDPDNYLNIKGTTHLKNFTLLESSLLSTIFRLYSLSGKNITSFVKSGLDFRLINCDFKSSANVLFFDHCQAISDQVLLRADSKYNLLSHSGIIEGMVFPTNLVNLPIILFQKIFRSKKSFLDTFEHKKNFTVLFSKDKKPVIKTNPISFVLPSVFSVFFASDKTIDN
jgi:hypothetical protein